MFLLLNSRIVGQESQRACLGTQLSICFWYMYVWHICVCVCVFLLLRVVILLRCPVIPPYECWLWVGLSDRIYNLRHMLVFFSSWQTIYKALPQPSTSCHSGFCCFLRIPISVMGNSVGNLGVLAKYLYLVSEKWEVLWEIKVALSPWTNHS